MGAFGATLLSRGERRKRVAAGALVLLLLIVLVLFYWLFWGRAEDPASRLLQLLEDYRSELEFPGRDVSEAARNLGSARAAYEFVVRDVSLVPYLDRRQTPDQVLATRLANPLDRAVLLGALLKEMGWDVIYLVFSPLEKTPLALGKPPPRNSPALLALRRFLSREVDLPSEVEEMARNAAEGKAGAALRREITAKVNKTLGLLKEKGLNILSYPAYSDQNTADQSWLLRRYVVVAERDGARRVFDPVYAKSDLMKEPELAGLFKIPLDQVKSTYRSNTFDMPKVEPTTIRLRLVDGFGLEQTLIEWRGNPAADEVELRFLPAIDPLGKLRDGTRPEQVDQWQPYLRVNGRQITGKPFSLSFAGASGTVGLRPPFDKPEAIRPANPKQATSLRIQEIDASSWPVVRVALSIKGNGSGLWLPDHFLLRDEGRPHPLRLLSVMQESRPLLILTDVSWSMGDSGAFVASKQAILSLLDFVADGMRVGLTSFAGSSRIEVPLGPLVDRKAFAARVEAMKMASATGILHALDQAAGQGNLAGGIVLLLSDGEDNVGGDEASIIRKLKRAGIRVFAVPLGEGADTRLLRRIAEQTGGQYAFQSDAGGLRALFRRIGAEISSLVQLQYKVDVAGQAAGDRSPSGDDDERSDKRIGPRQAGERRDATEVASSPRDAPARKRRDVSIVLRDTSIRAAGHYVPPARPARRGVPYLYLDAVTKAYDYNAVHTRGRRVLLRLDKPDAALRLTGVWSLIGDLGSYPERSYLVAYLSRWIDALRLNGVVTPAEARKTRTAGEERKVQGLDEWLADDERRWPGLARMRIVNAYRSLSRLKTRRGVVSPAPGPALYLHRAEFSASPGANGQTVRRRETFDVLMRPARPVHSGKWNQDTVAGEIAASIAEGKLLGGTDAVSALLRVASRLRPVRLGTLRARSGGNEFPPGFLAAIFPEWEDSWLIRSSENPRALWQIQAKSSNYWRNHFRAFLLDGDSFSKGASLEELARQFDRINSLLGLYVAVYGNFAGLTPFVSAEVAALAAFKQVENKMWCYSTLMLAQVGQAIEREDALLNRNVGAAKEKAARLCKIGGGSSSAEKGDVFREAARDAIREWVKGYGVNKFKEAAGGFISAGMSAWDVGRALHDVVRNFRSEGFASSSVPSGYLPPGKHNFAISPDMELSIARIVSQGRE